MISDRPSSGNHHMMRLVLLGLVTLVVGCSGTPPSRYYLMDAGPPPERMRLDGPVVFVDRVTVAAYADRSPMVVRRGETEVAFAEFNAWAEPVAGQMTTVVADALGNRFGRANVIPTPNRRDREPAFRVGIEVLRFEIGVDGGALVDARWTLLQGADERFATAGRAWLTVTPTDPDSFDSRAAALAEALVALADEIATAIEAARPS
jgi:uncharacterized lipoprotein YmbA